MSDYNCCGWIHIAWYLAYCCGWLVALKWFKTIYVMVFGNKKFI